MNRLCPYVRGEIVVYTPTREFRDKIIMTDYGGLVPGRHYKVTGIKRRMYVVIEGFEGAAIGGLDWTEFSRPGAVGTGDNRCPFQPGDLIEYSPSRSGKEAAIAAGLSGLVPHNEYIVGSVIDGLYVIPNGFESMRGLHWTEFVRRCIATAERASDNE